MQHMNLINDEKVLINRLHVPNMIAGLYYMGNINPSGYNKTTKKCMK